MTDIERLAALREMVESGRGFSEIGPAVVLNLPWLLALVDDLQAQLARDQPIADLARAYVTAFDANLDAITMAELDARDALLVAVRAERTNDA